MIGIKEIIIILLILFLLFYKSFFIHYEKSKYKGIEKGETEKVNIGSYNYIPKHIYKTGIDPYNKIHNDVKSVFSQILKLNPNFIIKYYSDKASRDFIKNNFKKEVINAYDKLIPGAYKADLFRYCILYVYGGVYSDLTQRITKPLEEIINFEKDKLYLVEDRDQFKITGGGFSKGIQISFMASRPGNDIFLKAIQQVIKNVDKKYYGDNPLYPTGPSLFYSILQDYKGKYKMELKETGGTIVNGKGETIIINRINNHQSVILKNRDHYSTLWRNRMIYKD